jgi:hypothetical protein
MKRIVPQILLLLCTTSVLVLSVDAQDTEMRSPSYSFSNGDTLTREYVLRASGPLLRYTRGVLLQSMVGFAEFDPKRREWQKVNESVVDVVKEAKGYCLKIGQAPCVDLPFTESELRAIKSFVVNKHVRGLSLSTDAREFQSHVEQELTKRGMTKVSGSLREEIWVSKHFRQQRRIVGMLEALDFGWVFTSAGKTDELERKRAAMNNAVRTSDPKRGPVVDESWLVSDIDANFVLFHEKGKLHCAGQPTRAHWRIYAGETYAYIWKLEALVAGDFLPAQLGTSDPAQEPDKWAAAGRWLFCITAALRALHQFAPHSLANIR